MFTNGSAPRTSIRSTTIDVVGMAERSARRTRPLRSAATAELSARDVNAVLGGLDLDRVREHHVELAAVTAELARDADLDWPWGHDDPTVALLRAIAMLAFVAPDATSSRAARLCAEVDTSSGAPDDARRVLATLGASA